MWTLIRRSWMWLLGILLTLAGVYLYHTVMLDQRVGPFWTQYRQVEVGMSEQQVMARLGPPSDELHPGGTLGNHFYSWYVDGEKVTVCCDIEGTVYDKKAPRETRWETFQRDFRQRGLFRDR